MDQRPRRPSSNFSQKFYPLKLLGEGLSGEEEVLADRCSRATSGPLLEKYLALSELLLALGRRSSAGQPNELRLR
jgi:hypothetical protein